MSDTILLVGHGSRESSGNQEVLAFADQWRARHPDWRIDVCFIELADVLLAAGLDAAAAGSKRVFVVPFILNAAGHVKMEIPAAIEEARQRHSQVQFRYAKHLGMNRTMLAILKRSLHRAMREIDMPDPKTTGVILLGRGSSDADANGDVAKMARWLFEDGDHELVDIAFTGITWPRLESAVQRQVKLGMTQVVVLPVYLFTGVLIERIKRQVTRLKETYPSVAFALGHHIGFDDGIFELVDTRVAGLRGEDGGSQMLECDGCKYRVEAAEHALYVHA